MKGITQNEGLKVSIIIPIYNLELYIANSIRSVVNQTYKNLEIIIVNDGSTDNSRLICEQWAAQDSRIKIFNQKNSGVSMARNVGLQHASGDAIMFLDGDDILHPKALEITVQDFETEEVILSVFAFQIIYNSNDVLSMGKDDITRENNEEYLKQFLQWKTNLSVWGKLYRADLAQRLCFVEGKKINEDRGYLSEYLLQNHGLVISHSLQMYGVLERIGSAGRSGFDSRYYDMLYFADKIKNDIITYNNKLTEFGVYNEIITKLMFLKYIVRAKKYKQEKAIFHSVKKQILLSTKEISNLKLGKYKLEVLFLRLGTSIYRLVVSVYDKLKGTKIYR